MRSSVEERISAGETPEIISLALSGGGADGAFGAGLLAGWTARSDQPEFTTASGVSTGAIVAVYAFLGPEYDDTPREIYTTYRTQDVFVPSYFAALTGGTALLDASGYRNLIERYIDDEAVRRIADEYRRGSVLLIGTTNIDASRPVTWDLGAIAASGHPDARQLIHDVIQASSAIPAAFPPVLIPVEAGGRHYDEMHVDGGATQQVMLFSPEPRATDIDRALGTRIERTAWVVMNNKLEKPYDPVRPRLAAFAGRSASSLIGGSGSGDIYRLYAVAERDRIKLNVISIPRGFDEDYSEMFDPVYTRSLYDLGHETALSGKGWRPYPPDFAPAGSGGAGAAKLRTGTAAFGANGK